VYLTYFLSRFLNDIGLYIDHIGTIVSNQGLRERVYDSGKEFTIPTDNTSVLTSNPTSMFRYSQYIVSYRLGVEVNDSLNTSSFSNPPIYLLKTKSWRTTYLQNRQCIGYWSFFVNIIIYWYYKFCNYYLCNCSMTLSVLDQKKNL